MDASAAVAGDVTGAAGGVVVVVVVVDEVVVVVDEVVVVDDVAAGFEVEQHELNVCGVPGAAAVSGVLPDPGVYDMTA